ncbi:MAG: homoserine O-acetyltransferase [Acidobacteria bacterium]|nr:homoserine O-acetyltransferase [Acidobacteriota bacterium]
MDDQRQLWWDSPGNQLAEVVHLDLGPAGFTARHGGHLPQVQVAYQSWGELNAARDNAVLIVHPLASDTHATALDGALPQGWWQELVGPGRAIDTDQFFVVCPNLLGGCYGTTGPRFHGPAGGPYLEDFPLLTPFDMMQVQRLFVRQLGIERLRMVIGPSMGGMVAWEWAIEGGDALELAVVVAAPLRTSPYQIGLNWLQRRGIELDLTGIDQFARWGQMMARGVGMLSYRAPVGLDEKFGREWFAPPGAVLRERGMFNIESWLRHHGKRIVKRFDPYTYILFSRAMDLHDVGERRHGFIAALDKVRCRTVVVGISSDHLYPPAEVHLGADILNHLGKPVDYAEIRSPHGHDAFLLETGQLAQILARVRERAPAAVPSAAQREVRTVRLGLLGAGQVAAQFLRLLDERRERLAAEYGLRFDIAAVADIDPGKRFDSVFERVELGFDPARLVRREDVDVVVEVTRGTDSRELVETALRRRRPVVTTNKLLVRRHGAELERLALDHGVRVAYHNAIAAGWPLLHAVERPLTRQGVSRIQAVLSSTCNVILERVEQGYSLASSIAFARALEITEPDPELDVSGWDTAQKLLILASRARELRFSIDGLTVAGIAELDPVLVREAQRLGLRVKLAALFDATADGAVGAVLPVAAPADGHLGGVRGEDNVVVLDGGETGELVYLGRGSGTLPVATAVLNDLLGLYHQPRSWTGAYPPGPRLLPPRFAHFLAREGGSAVIVDGPAAGAVPLLASLVR